MLKSLLILLIVLFIYNVAFASTSEAPSKAESIFSYPAYDIDAKVAQAETVGGMYRKEMYDQQGIYANETVYHVKFKLISNSEENQVEVAYYAKPFNSVSRKYLPTGEKMLTTSIQYNDFGFPSSVFIFSGQYYFFYLS